MRIQFLLITVIVSFTMILFMFNRESKSHVPLIAIANYGPHSSLEDSIQGIKEALANQGYIENKTIRFEITDVGFDTSLIPQMIARLKNQHPKVMIVMTTPVAQYPKATVKNCPIIFNVITDPVDSGLIKDPSCSHENMTGSSDQQNLVALLQFAKATIPGAKRVGILYGTAESNDIALIKMMESAARAEGMEVVSIPVDQARDVPLRMQGFKNKVDFIYVGSSGPIQPTLPVISHEANKMNIPIINASPSAVERKLVFASYGVNYKKVGFNAGLLAIALLKGTPISELTPRYPTLAEHHGYISRSKALTLGINIPENLINVTILE